MFSQKQKVKEIIMIETFNAFTIHCVCQKILGQCLEYLGYITLTFLKISMRFHYFQTYIL